MDAEILADGATEEVRVLRDSVEAAPNDRSGNGVYVDAINCYGAGVNVDEAQERSY